MAKPGAKGEVRMPLLFHGQPDRRLNRVWTVWRRGTEPRKVEDASRTPICTVRNDLRKVAKLKRRQESLSQFLSGSHHEQPSGRLGRSVELLRPLVMVRSRSSGLLEPFEIFPGFVKKHY